MCHRFDRPRQALPCPLCAHTCRSLQSDTPSDTLKKPPPLHAAASAGAGAESRPAFLRKAPSQRGTADNMHRRCTDSPRPAAPEPDVQTRDLKNPPNQTASYHNYRYPENPPSRRFGAGSHDPASLLPIADHSAPAAFSETDRRSYRLASKVPDRIKNQAPSR